LNSATAQNAAAETPLARQLTTRSNHVSSNVMCASLPLDNAHVTTGLMQRIRYLSAKLSTWTRLGVA